MVGDFFNGWPEDGEPQSRSIVMSDKELADKVVALGVGGKKELMDGWYFVRLDPNDCETYTELTTRNFVRDWRVAGALMEKISSAHVFWDDVGWACIVHSKYVTGGIAGKGDVDGCARHDMPRAIIEACVEALQEHCDE